MPIEAKRTPLPRTYFGARLRYWREVRGFTQAQLGRQLGYADSSISKLESAVRRPTPELARHCDDILDTGGELAALARMLAGGSSRQSDDGAPLPLTSSGQPGGRTNGVRRTIATGAGARHNGRNGLVVDASSAHSASDPDQVRPDASMLAGLTGLLEAYVDLDRTIGGSDLIETVEQHAHAFGRWDRNTPGPLRSDLRALAARFALLAGWLHFDCADHASAAAWYGHGYQWALASERADLISDLLTRQSSVRAAVGDTTGAIELARAAQSVGPGLAPSSKAWASLTEARAHAAAGDRAACEDALLRTERFAAEGAHDGPEWLQEPHFSSLFSLGRGTCYADLSSRLSAPKLAYRGAEDIDSSMSALPDRHGRDRALVTVRLARAWSCAREPERARRALAEVVRSAPGANSARVLAELGTVHRQLRPATG